MGTITTLRPSSTSSGVGWSAVPSGTLHGVTSDNSDASYALWSGDGSALILGTPVDSPPAGERRHQVRLTARGEDGNAWWSVRLSSGALVAGAAAQFLPSPSTVVGAWGFGAPPDGSTILYTYVTGQSVGVKINELYLDVDTRLAPTFSAQILDGSGTPSTVISDTTQPVVRADASDLDGLSARQYRYWVTSGATIVWDTGIVSGASANRQTTPLDNGSYTAHLQIWTTLGSNTEYPSDEETLAFTIAVGLVPAPDNPTVDPLDGTPFYTLTACAPFVGDFDGAVGYIEIQRVDCSTDTATVTVAMLGPLATGECADWVDYTLPRTAQIDVCDPQDPCCSYYRARTVGRVDGDLRISTWSDAFDPAIPLGLIVMWPDTAASVPSGWRRTTELDGIYPKSIPDAVTNPGTTGGAASHTHTVGSHVHSQNHTHTHTGNTSAAVGALNSTPNTVGTTEIQASHVHARSITTSASVSSDTATPSISTGNNDTDRLAVIFMESDGTPLGVPDGALGLMPDISVSGWTDYANATGRMLKGAAAAGNGGATAASALDSHTHSVGAHTHDAGVAHSHSATANSAASDRTLTTGAQQVLGQTSHTHSINVSSASTQTLAANSAANSGASTTPILPPYKNLRVKENTLGVPDLPIGLICAWRGSIGTIPDFWQLCDGTNGTPDMLGFYPRGATAAIGTTGGSNDPHDHTSASHTHTTTGHAHPETIASAGATTIGVSTTSTLSVATGTHTHTGTNTDSTTPTVSGSTSNTLASTTTEPLHEEVAFVQLMDTPVPPPTPDVFCLEWDDEEHLIRTLGPAGPMWANVKGQFTWDVDRPFTSANGVMGSRFVVSAPPGGRNLHMIAGVESEEELATLHAVLSRPLVLVSPSDADEVWAAPVAESVKVIQIGRIRQVTADFIGTGPQPAPQLADVGV